MRKSIFVLAFLILGVIGAISSSNMVSADKSSNDVRAATSAGRPENSTAQPVPFAQDWTNIALITANDDWAGVPGVVGYLGDYAPATAPINVDPRTVLVDMTVVDVIANQANPDTLTNGGVAEFEITNPVVALQGSGTADAPNLIVYVNTTGQNNIRFACNVRDIDNSIDNSVQQVAVQYRVGLTGSFSNIPGAYIADASVGPSLTTSTPLAVTLPPQANNQALVQIRILTTNAQGSDEWIGIDDISVTANGPANTARTSLDFNGDGRTDYAVTRDTGGLKTWYVAFNGSAATTGVQWGLESDKLAPADYDGDGKTDVAVWRDNAGNPNGDPNKAYFYILQSSTGTFKLEQFGRDNDRPAIVGDYDGDGKADVAVFRESDLAGLPCGVGKSVFYYRPSGTPAINFTAVCWGVPGDTPTGGDFDGDGKFDFCVRRDVGGSGVFFLRRSSDSAVEYIYWGLPTDAIAPGDYDGDGRYDFGVGRINTTTGGGEFYILERDGGGTGPQPITISDITENDFIAQGDYDGDGRTDIGLWRGNADPAQNFFVIRKSSNGAFEFFEWGQLGDEPVAEWNVDGGQK